MDNPTPPISGQPPVPEPSSQETTAPDKGAFVNAAQPFKTMTFDSKEKKMFWSSFVNTMQNAIQEDSSRVIQALKKMRQDEEEAQQ
jgi:hypothetical protein